MSIFSFKTSPPEIAYGDPSFFIGVLIETDDYHSECAQFAEELEKSAALVGLSPLGLDEIWFVLLRIYATRDFGERAWQHVLKNEPEIAKRYALEIEQTHNQLLALPYVILIDMPTEHFLHGLEMMKTYGLFPRDAIHVGLTKLSGITNLITTNRDYARVPEINVYTCNVAALRTATTP